MTLLDGLLDRTILLSFDRSGFERHARGFRPGDLDVDLEGRVALVTGASSGLGLATARALAALGAKVRLLCRSEEKGRAALRSIRAATGNERLQLDLVDVSDLGSVRRFARRLGPERLDVLVHNAAVLPPSRLETRDGLELTFATNVVGPFLLTALLLPRLRRSRDARLVHVSSGGMYARRLDLADVDWRHRPFDGVLAYAQTKRMLVALSELWAARLAGSSLTVSAMHPGWADTPGVRESLPTFFRLMGGRLRTPEQGADTVVWLAASREPAGRSGLFWFDRRPVSTHLVPWTREPEQEPQALFELCRRLSGAPIEAVAPGTGGAGRGPRRPARPRGSRHPRS